AVPRLAMIARSEQELRADVDCSLLVRRKRDRRIPVEPELLIVIWPGLDIAGFMCVSIYASDFPALILGIDVIRISRILEHPEPIAIVHVFPLRVGDAAGILRVAYPRAVILQSAIDVVRIVIVQAYMVKLGYRQVFAFPPFAAAVVRVPNPAVVSH